MNKLGTIALDNDVLAKANIGLWAFELDEGQEPRMYADDMMLKLIGLEHQVSPEETVSPNLLKKTRHMWSISVF